MRPQDWLNQLFERYACLQSCEKDIVLAYEVLVKTFESNCKLLICGNGGSSSDADHIAGELLKGFMLKRNPDKSNCGIVAKLQKGLPAIPLANLTGIMTAYSNDCDPQLAFAQLTFSLGNKNDSILCISTSGNSKNVAYAAEVAKEKGMHVLSLTGLTGGILKNLSDVCICAPETVTFKIQELHLPIYHCLCLMLESHFFKN